MQDACSFQGEDAGSWLVLLTNTAGMVPVQADMELLGSAYVDAKDSLAMALEHCSVALTLASPVAVVVALVLGMAAGIAPDPMADLVDRADRAMGKLAMPSEDTD
jgi:hypothetical protein